MTVLVEMISDFACPWCWVGLRRLTKAVQLLKLGDDIELKFRPFQLSPEIPEAGKPYKTYIQEKFGEDTSTSQWKPMQDMLEEIGKTEDIPFRFGDITIRPNTVNAHRLARWSQGQKLGPKAQEIIFNAYFSAGKNIGSKDTLVSLAEEIGLHPDVVSKLLSEHSDLNAVAEDEQFFRSMGVNGVPVFIINRKFALQGAQDVEILQQYLKQGFEGTLKSL